ncbi:hypothetical protein L9F63_008265, partial [Diploptera punctata]
YGQEDEDRQWDSGGYYYQDQYGGVRDQYENRINDRRSANRKVNDYATSGKIGSQEEGEDEYYSPQGLSYEEDYNTASEYPPPTANAINSTPTATRRRLGPRRTNSRQSSTEDYEYISNTGGYYDDYRRDSVIAATTTVTSTTTSAYTTTASSGRTNQLPKPPVSAHKHQLPPTPVRQLPHHSASDTAATTTTPVTSRRNNAPMSRTASAEYADQDSYSGYSTYYGTPSRDIGKDSGYNEDYNYAYRSIDNLATTQQDSVEEEVLVHDKRTNDGRMSATGTRGYQQTPATPNLKRGNSLTQQQQQSQPQLPQLQQQQKQQAYMPQQSSEEYYYNAQDDRDYVNEEEDMGYYNDTTTVTTTTTNSNTTRKKFLAARRENSPLLQQNTDSLESRDDELRDSFETAMSDVSRRGYDYSTPAETITPTTSTATPADILPKSSSIPMTSAVPIVPVSATNYMPPQTTQQRSPSLMGGRDQEPSKLVANAAPTVTPVVTTAVSSPVSAIVTTTTSTTAASITSTVNNTVLPPHNAYQSQTSVTNRGHLRPQDSLDSCAEEMSSIHSASMDYYPKNYRDSPPSVMDRYRTDTPVEPYTPPPGRFPQENSLIEPYQPSPPKAASVHASPSPPSMIQKQQSLDEQSHTSLIESPTASADRQSSQGQGEKSKSVSFEDEEEVKPERRKMTAKERWHWAYNKIVMQLNEICNRSETYAITEADETEDVENVVRKDSGKLDENYFPAPAAMKLRRRSSMSDIDKGTSQSSHHLRVSGDGYDSVPHSPGTPRRSNTPDIGACSSIGDLMNLKYRGSTWSVRSCQETLIAKMVPLDTVTPRGSAPPSPLQDHKQQDLSHIGSKESDTSSSEFEDELDDVVNGMPQRKLTCSERTRNLSRLIRRQRGSIFIPMVSSNTSYIVFYNKCNFI